MKKINNICSVILFSDADRSQILVQVSGLYFVTDLKSACDLMRLVSRPYVSRFSPTCQSGLLPCRRIKVEPTSTVPPLPPSSSSPVAPSSLSAAPHSLLPGCSCFSWEILFDLTEVCFPAKLESTWRYPQFSLPSLRHRCSVLTNPHAPLIASYLHLNSPASSPCVLLESWISS